MKIVIITQDEPFYLPVFFKTFFREIESKDIFVKCLVNLPAFDETLFDTIKRGYEFYGPRKFPFKGFEYVRLKVLDALGLANNSVLSVAESFGVSTKTLKSGLTDSNFLSELKKDQPDVILSVASPELFTPQLISIPKWGCVNIHSSNLPKYRGMMPNFWAMYHGDDTAGITVHTMDEELDKGKIILQDEIEIRPEDTLDSLIKRSKKRGAELVVKALEQIKNGEVKLKDYEGEGSYFSFPTKEDVKEFRRRGNRLL